MIPPLPLPTGTPPGPVAPDAPVNIQIGAVVQQIHGQYQKMIQMLTQENAEAQAGLEAQANELRYLRSVVAAQTADVDTPPSADGQVITDPLG